MIRPKLHVLCWEVSFILRCRLGMFYCSPDRRCPLLTSFYFMAIIFHVAKSNPRRYRRIKQCTRPYMPQSWKDDGWGFSRSERGDKLLARGWGIGVGGCLGVVRVPWGWHSQSWYCEFYVYKSSVFCFVSNPPTLSSPIPTPTPPLTPSPLSL